MRRSILLAGALALSVLALRGCSSTLPPAGPGAPDDVSSVRLFDGAGIDRTGHLFLFRDDTLHLELRLYAHDGRQVTSVTGGLDVTLAFDPPTVATAVQAPGDPLFYAVTTAATVNTGCSLQVSLRFLANGNERSFGPFECLVH